MVQCMGVEVRKRRLEHGRNVQRKLTTALLREWQHIAQREDVIVRAAAGPEAEDRPRSAELHRPANLKNGAVKEV